MCGHWPPSLAVMSSRALRMRRSCRFNMAAMSSRALLMRRSCRFNMAVERDAQVAPNGFIYLRANPGTCVERMKRRCLRCCCFRACQLHWA